MLVDLVTVLLSRPIFLDPNVAHHLSKQGQEPWLGLQAVEIIAYRLFELFLADPKVLMTSVAVEVAKVVARFSF